MSSGITPIRKVRVAAAVLVKDRKVFLARRNEGSLRGHWEFPGGKIETGETPEMCLIRELREELSIDVRIGSYIGTGSDVTPAREIELIVHWAEPVRGEIVLCDHDACEWVEPLRLGEFHLAPADVPFIPLITAALAENAPPIFPAS